ncbi:MAG: hypothetical protein WBA43_22305, partial [Elainellaceae cyanobacterium]
MTKTTSVVAAFIGAYDSQLLAYPDLDHAVEAICRHPAFKDLLLVFIDCQVFSPELGQEFASLGAIQGLAACRRLRSSLNLSLASFFALLAELIAAFDVAAGVYWSAFASRVQASTLGDHK